MFHEKYGMEAFTCEDMIVSYGIEAFTRGMAPN